ncbi:hypothetical protein ACFX19_001920 [Malus domestica]
MHDLLQEMGWEIVHQESNKDPGRRSSCITSEDVEFVSLYTNRAEVQTKAWRNLKNHHENPEAELRVSLTNVSPWITTVGANTMDRDFPATVKLENGRTITGVSLYRGRMKLSTNKQYHVAYLGSNSTSHNPSSLCLEGTLDLRVVARNCKRRGACGGLQPALSVVFPERTNVFVLTLHRTVTNVALVVSNYHAIVSPFKGAYVKVKPRTLKFTKANQKLSYKIIFTTKSRQAVPEFGGLVWKDAVHRVRSVVHWPARQCENEIQIITSPNHTQFNRIKYKK